MYNVTIAAGMTSSSFDVEIIDNMIQDGDKIFTITIRLISICFTIPTTINSSVTMVTIKDDEGKIVKIPYYLVKHCCVKEIVLIS